MKTILFLCLLLGCIGCHKLSERYKQQAPTNVFYNLDDSKDTLNSMDMHVLAKYGFEGAENADKNGYEDYYKLIRFNDKDTTYKDFIVVELGGSGGNGVRVFINKKECNSFWGDLDGYYIDKTGNKTPIFTMQVASRYENIRERVEYTDCEYIYSATYITTRGKLTNTTLEMDSILNLDGNPLDRYLYDSISAVYFPEMLHSKSTQTISVDNFRKIHIIEHGVDGGKVLDCLSYSTIDTAKAILVAAEPAWNKNKIYPFYLFLHYFTHPKYGKCALVAYYDYPRSRTIIASATEPYKIYNNIRGDLQGYYTDVERLPMPAVEHDTSLTDNMGRWLSVLYRWHKDKLFADSTLSVNWDPLTPKQKNVVYKNFISNNYFDQIKQ